MAAKRRNGSVAGNNLSDGTKPIEPIVAKAKKAEDSLRVKRDGERGFLIQLFWLNWVSGL